MSGTRAEREVSRLFRLHLRGRLTLGEFARASRGVSEEVLRATIEGEWARLNRRARVVGVLVGASMLGGALVGASEGVLLGQMMATTVAMVCWATALLWAVCREE